MDRPSSRMDVLTVLFFGIFIVLGGILMSRPYHNAFGGQDRPVDQYYLQHNPAATSATRSSRAATRSSPWPSR